MVEVILLQPSTGLARFASLGRSRGWGGRPLPDSRRWDRTRAWQRQTGDAR